MGWPASRNCTVPAAARYRRIPGRGAAAATRTVYDAIQNAEPAGMPKRFAFAESVWRHYETVGGLPAGTDSDRRCDLPVQSGLCPGHERRCEGGEHTGRPAGGARVRIRSLAGLPQDFLAEVQPWIAGARACRPPGSGPSADPGRTLRLISRTRIEFAGALHRPGPVIPRSTGSWSPSATSPGRMTPCTSRGRRGVKAEITAASSATAEDWRR